MSKKSQLIRFILTVLLITLSGVMWYGAGLSKAENSAEAKEPDTLRASTSVEVFEWMDHKIEMLEGLVAEIESKKKSDFRIIWNKDRFETGDSIYLNISNAIFDDKNLVDENDYVFPHKLGRHFERGIYVEEERTERGPRFWYYSMSLRMLISTPNVIYGSPRQRILWIKVSPG